MKLMTVSTYWPQKKTTLMANADQAPTQNKTELKAPVALLNYFRRSLPHAELLACTLPSANAIRLWLVNPEIMQSRLPEDVVLAIFEDPAYWAFCWASGQALACEILAKPELVSDKTVMDFGSGSGVVAIAAALAGAKKVIACDCDPGALLAIEANAELNQIELVLNGDYFADQHKVDVLLAADVLYDQENKPLLADFLTRADCVLLADSRVKNFSQAGYQHLAVRESITYPDMGELEEFRQVNFYSNCTGLL